MNSFWRKVCNFQSWYVKEGCPGEIKGKFTLASEDFETIKGENDIENTSRLPDHQ